MEKIKWYGHASFKISGEKVIYIDPWKIQDEEKADIILISHSHYDHFSLEDIKKITTRETEILMTPDCQSKLRDVPERVTLIYPMKKYNVKNILIETTPSYNINKKFHPKENDWVGFIISNSKKRIFYTGDTDNIPEIKNIKADIALIPISGTYVMDYKEAADLVNTMKPKIAIPYHYGDIVGTEQDALKFKKLAKIPVEILTKQ
jgi:L-ascorbate metabolism protein UlaG (beta-lactamase superfamily)